MCLWSHLYISRRDPLCKIGTLWSGTDASVEVDHVIRAEVWIAMQGGDQSHFLDEGNLQGRMYHDHSAKTTKEASE